jgi:hypothetical protein
MRTLKQAINSLPVAERAEVRKRVGEITRTSKPAPMRTTQRTQPAGHRARPGYSPAAARSLPGKPFCSTCQLTEVNMAKLLGVRQESISKIEHRSDMLISSFRSYIEALGDKLRLVVEFPDVVAEITSLSEPDDNGKPPGGKRPELVLTQSAGSRRCPAQTETGCRCRKQEKRAFSELASWAS